MKRLITSFLSGTVMAVVLVVSPVFETHGEANSYGPDSYLSMGNCWTSGTGYYLCAEELNSGFYGLRWDGYTCSFNQSDWDSIHDLDCVTGFSHYGNHDEQTSSAGSDGYAVMQGDANFVLYTSGNSPVWVSNSNGGYTDPFLNLQSDGNMVIYYYGSIPLWSLF